MERASSATVHHLAPEESAALAWMLEVTAQHCWMDGAEETAIALEGGAVAFRLAGVHHDECDIVMDDGAIEDLTSIAWDLLDQISADPELIAELAEPEWSHIGAELLTRDDAGEAFAQFIAQCGGPEDLPAYAAGMVSRLRVAAHIEFHVV